MKKMILFISLAVLASILVAATPSQLIDAPAALGVGQDNYQKQGQCYDPLQGKWVPCNGKGWKVKYPGQGEPRMEKVTSFRYVSKGKFGWGSTKCDTGWVISTKGCSWYYCIRSYNLPVGCNFRYQY